MADKRGSYNLTVLNFLAGLILLDCITKLIFGYQELAAGEGWGIAGVISLGGVGLAVLLIDFIIQKLSGNRP